MMIWKRIRQYRVYRRLVLSYMIVIVLSIALVSTILYSLFSAKAVKEIDRSSRQMLSHVSYTANVVYQQVQDISGQLLVDKDVTSFFYYDHVDKLADYKAYMIISKIQSVYPFIKNIGLYNFTNGEYEDTLGLQRDPSIRTENRVEYLGIYPRVTQKDDGTPLKLLSFRIVPERDPDTNTPKYALVLDVDEAYIQNTISSINSAPRNGTTFVLNANGEVLSHSDSSNFMSDFSDRDYVERILRSGLNQGSFVQSIGGKKNLVTYVRSPLLDWFFVSVQPYNELLSDIYSLRNWTWMISVLLIALGGAIALLLTGNIYNPIRRLVDQVTAAQGTDPGDGTPLKRDEYALLSNAFMTSRQSAELLESKLTHSRRLLENSSLLSLLNGVDKAMAEQLKREWGGRLKGPYFRVIMFKIDNAAQFRKTYPPMDRELLRFAVGNIAHELLGKQLEIGTAVMEEEIVSVVQSGRKEPDDALYLTLLEIQDAIRAYYKITVTASIGDDCESLAGLRDSYLSAQKYGGYRLFLGYSAIIDAARALQDREPDRPYPAAKERKLIDAVKLCSDKSIQAELDDWIAELARCTYAQAMQFTNLLLLTLIREFEYVGEWHDAAAQNMYVYLHQVQQVETLEQLRAALAEFCGRIVALIEENRQQVSALRNARVIEEVKQLIAERHADPQLSLDYVAGQVGLSTGYLGKLFKSHMQSTFNDYVTLVRIEQAKRLLATTNDIVADVGVKVGISGAAYFSTVFKRHTGMSPSQYRENQKG